MRKSKHQYKIRDLKFNIAFYNIYNKQYWINATKNKIEPNTFDMLDLLGNKNYSFIDVGCAVGTFSLYASQKYQNVISIDPNLESLSVFKKNLKLNKINNVTLLKGFLGIEKGIVKFKKGRYFNKINLFKVKKTNYKIKSYILDDIINKVKSKKIFIKIDIEGYEFNLLNSNNFIETLSKYKPSLHLSIHHGFSNFLKYKRSKMNYFQKFLNLDKTFKEYLLINKLFKIYKNVYINKKKISFLYFLNPKYYRKNIDMFFKN